MGVSLYRGDSAANRPKPDMKGTSANVTISDLHAPLHRQASARPRPVPLRAARKRRRGQRPQPHPFQQSRRAAQPRGKRRERPLPRGGLGHPALACAARPGERLDLFVRYDDYDTMAEVPDGFFDNPRFDRRVYTVGFNYGRCGQGSWSRRITPCAGSVRRASMTKTPSDWHSDSSSDDGPFTL